MAQTWGQRRVVKRGKYGQTGARDALGRLKKRKKNGTKKGQVRKTARRAYKPKKSTKKKTRGRTPTLPKSKKYKVKGKKRAFTRISTHSSKAAAQKKTGKQYYYRIAKGGKRYGLYRRKK